MQKIGLGGGCHWCTKAVFQALVGVEDVAQGYIASTSSNSAFSEAVVVSFRNDKSHLLANTSTGHISLETLLEIHLHTHKSTVDQSFREKYRSAIYYFSEEQRVEVDLILIRLQKKFENPLVTLVLPHMSFKASRESLHNYYSQDPNRPFCERFISPKLTFLQKKYMRFVKH